MSNKDFLHESFILLSADEHFFYAISVLVSSGRGISPLYIQFLLTLTFFAYFSFHSLAFACCHINRTNKAKLCIHMLRHIANVFLNDRIVVF